MVDGNEDQTSSSRALNKSFCEVALAPYLQQTVVRVPALRVESRDHKHTIGHILTSQSIAGLVTQWNRKHATAHESSSYPCKVEQDGATEEHLGWLMGKVLWESDLDIYFARAAMLLAVCCQVTV